MNPVHEHDFLAAQDAYLVANTPSYLVRKLREDPAVAAFSSLATEDELLEEFQRIASSPPSNLGEKIYPYVLLVALAQKNYRRSLFRALEINPENVRWFPEVIAELLRETSPTSVTALYHGPGVAGPARIDADVVKQLSGNNYSNIGPARR